MPALAHLGIGFAIKRFTTLIPLWALLLSSMVLDILSFVLTLALWITHGLFMSVMWSAFAFLITIVITYWLKSRRQQNSNLILWNKKILNIGVIIALVVFSHWILDFIGWPMSVINDYKGVPLLFDDAVYIGLGVYSTWFGALLMDIGVFVIGLIIYIHYKLRIKK
ncbi:MAG: hypothetical protein ACFFD7_10055 [Candidatus Thorarchaeota archaeon]